MYYNMGPPRELGLGKLWIKSWRRISKCKSGRAPMNFRYFIRARLMNYFLARAHFLLMELSLTWKAIHRPCFGGHTKLLFYALCTKENTAFKLKGMFWPRVSCLLYRYSGTLIAFSFVV